MGKVSSNEEIQAPVATSEAKTPQPDEPVASLPSNSQPGKLEQAGTPKNGETVVVFPPESQPRLVEQAGTPEKLETVVSFPPESRPGEIEEAGPEKGETVVPFPPESESGRVEEIQPVQTAQPVAALPPNAILPPPIGNPWTTGLFDCTKDPTNAVMTALFPCVTFGQIAEVLDAGEQTCPLGSFIYLLMMPGLCSCWIMGSKYRTKLRMRFGLVQAPYDDGFSHIFCPFCSLCQEFRELRNRGLDPTLGWNGIIAQRRQLEMMHANQQMNNPPPIQAMSK